MDCSGVATDLAQTFHREPYDYLTKHDLVVRLVEYLRHEARISGAEKALLEKPFYDGRPLRYKEQVQHRVEERLRERGHIDRVHSHVSIAGTKWFDVGVFSERIENPIGWRSNGSKEFDGDDLDAVFQIEYIINKAYFPVDCGIRNDQILQMSEAELKDELDMEANNNGPDLDSLNGLSNDIDAFYLLFSNNNYLFREPLTQPEKQEEKKRRVGETATRALRERADDVTLIYAHPGGFEELNA